MSRWIELYATSNSGKTLFVCKMCGRVSPLPNKECASLPTTVSWKGAYPCHVLEEMEEALIEARERPRVEHAKIRMHISSDGKFLTWEPIDRRKDPRSGYVEIVKSNDAEYELKPDGYINNCALNNYDDEKNCQICNGECPQRERFR